MPKDFTHWGIKTRKFADKNYHAIWNNLVTLRLGTGVAKQLDFPEFYDVAINNTCNFQCPFCFLPGSKVKTKEGYEAIEKIVENVMVWTKNEKTGTRELKPVEQLHERDYVGDVITVETSQGKFTLTPNHKVYITGKGWIEASYLAEGDDIEMFYSI